MAIAFDSSSIGTQVGASSLTWSHTCTGSNLILFVSLMLSTTDMLTGITYNGVAMTLVDKGIPAGGRYTYLYYLINPSTGANNVVASCSGSTFPQGVSASYTGANQSAQPDATNKNTATSGTSLTTTLTTIADNCWTIMAVGNYGGDSTAGAGTTRRNTTNGIGLMDSNAAKTPAGSTSLVSNMVSGNLVINIMASFKPVATTVNYTMTVIVGAFTLTGISALFHLAWHLVTSVGQFTLTGINVVLGSGRKIVTAVGQFILTGIASSAAWNTYSSTTYINQSKSSSSSFTNQSKNSTSWTNKDKSI